MSRPERPPDAGVPTSKLERKSLRKEDQDELDKLDSIFDRIKRAVPTAPYVLSTPSLDEYTHYSRHESTSWMIENLFTSDEEHLQYRTFHYREPYQDCFTLQPGEEEEPEAERPKSQASSTSNQAPKKKISLSAYKSKQANGVITPGAKKISPNLPPTKPTKTAKPPPVQTNGVKTAAKEPATVIKKEEVPSHKRPATETLVSQKPEKRVKEERPPAPPPQKTESAESKINIDTTGPLNATPHGLPPLLSPVEQPLNNPYGLPSILSPTLPSSIQAELDRIETKRRRAESDASNSSSQLPSVPESRPPRREEGGKTTPQVRSLPINGKPPTSVPPKPAESATPTLVVRLKFGKNKKETLKNLLRLPPARKTVAVSEKKDRVENAKEQRPVKAQAKATDGIVPKAKDVPKITARRPESSTPNVKVTPVARIPEKRPRIEDDGSLAVPAKRPRASTLQDRPRTPSQQVPSSPPRSKKSSAPKLQLPYTTPRKDHKAVSMLRTSSADGYDSTPGRSGATPAASKHLDPKAPPTSAPLNAKKQADIQSLSQISMKLNQMGRSLKHEAQKVVLEKGSRATKEDLKRAAVTSLECILSYMAAYHAQDISLNLRGRPGEVENTWKTLLPLCVSYAGRTKDFPHLDGLRSYLSAAISAAICIHVSPRAPRPKAHDSPHDSQTELTKQHALVTENFHLMADHYQKLHRFTSDSRLTLPVDEIQKLYPKTWVGREPNTRLMKEAGGTKLSGPYFLPIELDTTPIQAVRFGLKLLVEYCEREKLEYSLKVNLEKAE